MAAKIIPTLLCLALLALCFTGIWWGWRNRLRRQSAMFGSLKDVPARYDGAEALASFEGEYVSTTMFGDWLDRVGFDGLGFKTKSTLLIYDDGIIFTRNGAKDLWIPARKLAVITTGQGMAGKVVERDGLLIIGWTLDGHRVQTGFRTRYADQKNTALKRLRAIAPEAVSEPQLWAPQTQETTATAG